MDEFDLIKLQKCYEEFVDSPSEQLAADIELKCDMLKVALGDRFYDLRHFLRISNSVSDYLDSFQQPETEIKIDAQSLSKIFGGGDK